MRRSCWAALAAAIAACAPSGPPTREPPHGPAEARSSGAPDNRETIAPPPAASAEHAPGIGRADATGVIRDALIVSAVDGGDADAAPKRARRDQTVTLYAVIVVGEGRDARYYSDAPVLRVGRAPVAAAPLADAPAALLRWRKVEPVQPTMSNTESGGFAFESIEYQATPMPAASGRGAIAADVHPTLTPDHGNGVGTMRYQIEVTQDGRTVASAGVDARRGRGSGGLTDDVHRISLRRDDTYLGYLTELYGQPYIWASAGTTDHAHQSERLEGCDCADFVVYGRRRLAEHGEAKALPYTWTGELPKYTKLLAKGNRAADGVFRDAAGEALPFTGVGDIILFPRHVGVLTEDREPVGVLDDGDVMMHSLFDTPKEVAIRDSTYADTPTELRRWK
jgi:hypothetical protein